MMRKKVETKRERKRFSAEFKRQALLWVVKDGVPAVAQDLGLEPAQIYACRAKAYIVKLTRCFGVDVD